MKKDNGSISKGVAVGAGIIAAMAAGTYFLYGSKNAAKNRKKVKAWTLYARGEIMEKLEELSEVNEEMYQKIVKEVSEKYKALKNIDEKDVSAFVNEVKSHWKGIAKDLGLTKKKAKKAKK